MKLSVVTPTYNEAANVRRLIAEISAVLQGMEYEIVVADDNSPDGTWAIVGDIGQNNPRVRVLRRMKNSGLSPSVIDGFLAGVGEYVACIDADLQHDPNILRQMAEALDHGAQVAVGSRYVSGGCTGKWTPLRRFESWVATKLAQMFLGVELYDPMSGYFMLRRADFETVCSQLNARGFKILLEIVARLAPEELKEIPYTFRAREAGESKLSSKVILQYLGQLWRLSSISRYMSVRFIKFAIVGASGTIVNLCIFLASSQLLGLHDWRISALASLISNLTNYVSNNAWTFVDRGHRGWELIRGYAWYLSMSLVGLLASTLTFAGLSYGFHRFPVVGSGHESKQLLLGFQLIAILVGTFFNYELNKRFTWRDYNKSSRDADYPSVRRSVSELRTAQE